MSVVEELREQGYAYASITDFFPYETWETLSWTADEWAASDVVQEHAQPSGPLSALDAMASKTWMARRLHGFDEEDYAYDVDDPFLEVGLSPTFIDLAQEYFHGTPPRLAYYDLWHNFVMPETEARVGSLQWHRDAEANGHQDRILKVFLYFTDVDEEGAGPLEMFLSPSQKLICWRPRGGLLFIDTGKHLHRGGFCTTKPRTLCIWYYFNPSLVPFNQLVPRYTLTAEAKKQHGNHSALHLARRES